MIPVRDPMQKTARFEPPALAPRAVNGLIDGFAPRLRFGGTDLDQIPLI